MSKRGSCGLESCRTLRRRISYLPLKKKIFLEYPKNGICCQAIRGRKRGEGREHLPLSEPLIIPSQSTKLPPQAVLVRDLAGGSPRLGSLKREKLTWNGNGVCSHLQRPVTGSGLDILSLFFRHHL